MTKARLRCLNQQTAARMILTEDLRLRAFGFRLGIQALVGSQKIFAG